eukprot:gene11658-biopygen7097
MSTQFDIAETKRKMQSAIQSLKQELSGLRTGRASANLLEPIMVTAYGQTMPLNQVATISVPEPRALAVQVWDKGMVNAVDKAIRDANLGLSPTIEGQILRIRMPELNEQRRKEMVKIAHKYAEEGRVAVRHVRRDGIDQLKKALKDKVITEDDEKRLTTDIQKIDYLTVYSFSTENWSRPVQEVSDLMGLLKRFIRNDLADLHRQNVRVRIIGERANLSADIRQLLDEAEQISKDNTGLTLIVAFNYGGRQELTKAVRQICAEVAAGALRIEDISPDTIGRHLETSGIPDPDFIIRTSGEQRLSNFLLWQKPLNLLDLRPRLISGVVMIVIAVTANVLGGRAFDLFWLAAACAIYWEWLGLVLESRPKPLLMAGIIALALIAALNTEGLVPLAVLVLALGLPLLAVLAPSGRRLWVLGGLIYAASLIFSTFNLRMSFPLGQIAIFWLFAVVWGTDIMAYFGGRLLDVQALAKVALEHRVQFAAIADPAAYAELKSALAGSTIECAAGPEAIIAAACYPADLVVAAIAGTDGVLPTCAALELGRTVALANKESLVCAGSAAMRLAAQHNALILPMDSEHNAIYQALGGHDPANIETMVLTASGGPFRTWPLEKIAHATRDEALAHPNWSMGPKITIDSASMMNKGLELIEAHHLFGVPAHKLRVLVHPQSIVHGLVSFSDGSVTAGLACPDMRVPIAHCLAWPDRITTNVPRLDLARLASLTFEAPDLERFPALQLAFDALKHGFAGLFILLTAVVFFHELGHFLVGRWCGVKVDVFSIGFGPELFGFVDRAGTRWRFAALPLGGYVKFHGDLNGASIPDPESLSHMPAPERAQTLAGKAVWQRALIVAAGPAANFILAIVIYTGLFYTYGREVVVPKIATVVGGSAAERAGLLAGDIVLQIGNSKISNFGDLQRIVQSNADTPLVFTIDRGGMQSNLTIVPEQKEISTFVGKQSVGILGVQASNNPADARYETYGLGSSVELAALTTWQRVELTGNYFSRLFSGRESSDKISGLMRTAEVAGKMAEIGVNALLEVIAIMSISIGLMNLLPVPVLDGGHLVFYAIEALRGRPLSERTQEFGFRIGLIAIVALVLFANFNDIIHMRAASAAVIDVEGNHRVEAETIRSYFAGDDIAKAEKDLKATGLFSSVSIRRVQGHIVVHVVENNVINQVAFEGNSKLKGDEIRPELQSKSRGPFDPAVAQADAQRILDIYKRSGRGLAKVTYRIVDLPNGRLDLVFTIVEGDKTGVKAINFVGNEAYSASKLRGLMATTEMNFMSFFKTSDVYDADKIASDAETIRRYYLKNGYADVQITKTDTVFDAAQGGWIVTIGVSEGPQYRVSSITVDSKFKDISGDELAKRVNLSVGDVYNGTAVEKSMESMTRVIAGRGYAFSQIHPRGDRNAAAKTVALSFVVEEGPRVYIERLNIHGNTRTRDYVIRREFDLGEGDAYNHVLIEKGERRLNQLGFFKSVHITSTPGSSPDRVVVNVEVEDQATGSFGLSGGYSTADGIIGEVSLTETNFLGRGQYVRVAVSGGQKSRGVELNFTEPNFMDQRIAAGFDLFRKQTDSSKYTLYQNWVTGEIQGTTITSLGGYTLAYNTLDDMKNPANGFYAEMKQDVAGLGGNSHFVKTTGQARYYHEIYDDFVGFVKVQGGNVFGYGNKDLRLVDNFNLGPELVRGFAPSGIGPRDISDSSNTSTNSLGGTNYFGGTAEVQFPIFGMPRELGLKGALFADAGTLFGYSGKTNFGTGSCVSSGSPTYTQATCIDLGNTKKPVIRSSVGASLIWASPLGPIRFDYAFVLTKAQYDVQLRLKEQTCPASLKLSGRWIVPKVPPTTIALTSREPYRAFALVLGKLFPSALRPVSSFGARGVSPGVSIHPTARLEKDVTVDPGAVIGPGVEIGSGSFIGANSVIGAGVRIGRDCSLGPHVSVLNALLGNRVIVLSGARIGQDGFGFAMGPQGHLKVPQIGRVILQDDVEIGANTTIDRGANRDTIVGEGTKIDNLVQIAHNVVIGRHCVITAQVGIAGSTQLDDFVVIGGQSGIAGHLKIGMAVQIAACSAGHFPESPVMPGVLLIEGMAQTAGAICVHSAAQVGKPKLVYFMTIDKVKFRKPVIPGDRVEFHMTKTNHRRNMWWYSGKAMVDDVLVCEAEISAMLIGD